jgi:hypothetical protein
MCCKGNILQLLYNDHLALERKRELYEQILNVDLNHKIEKLEEVVSLQRDQLKDKTIEMYELEKMIKKYEKKSKKNEKKIS